MRFALPRSPLRLTAFALALLIDTALFAGCATEPTNSKPASATASRPATHSSPPGTTPVTRYGRYTLVELVPGPAQQDLMQQVVDITIPATATASVGDALRYLLLRTGYQLCDAQNETAALNAFPLPAAHIHLGPLSLRDALQVLSGPAWQLQIDDSTRRVCFTHSDAPARPASLPIEESR